MGLNALANNGFQPDRIQAENINRMAIEAQRRREEELERMRAEEIVRQLNEMARQTAIDETNRQFVIGQMEQMAQTLNERIEQGDISPEAAQQMEQGLYQMEKMADRTGNPALAQYVRNVNDQVERRIQAEIQQQQQMSDAPSISGPSNGHSAEKG